LCHARPQVLEKENCLGEALAILAPSGAASTHDPFDLEGADRALERWRVLQVKSRQEKALARDLSGLGIRCFVPLYHRSRMWQSRRFETHVPLFPGYIFVHGSVEDAYRADQTRRVARIIEVADQRRLVLELNQLRLALEQGIALDPYPYFRQGVRVRVTCGPLQGLQGMVESRTRMDRLILQVDILGQAVSMEIDCSVLETIA
jgi:transcriptional antiterminator NusG